MIDPAHQKLQLTKSSDIILTVTHLNHGNTSLVTESFDLIFK